MYWKLLLVDLFGPNLYHVTISHQPHICTSGIKGIKPQTQSHTADIINTHQPQLCIRPLNFLKYQISKYQISKVSERSTLSSLAHPESKLAAPTWPSRPDPAATAVFIYIPRKVVVWSSHGALKSGTAVLAPSGALGRGLTAGRVLPVRFHL